MNRLSRYIFWQLFVGVMLVAAGISCVVWLSQSLRFVDMIVNRGLGAGLFVTLTGLMLPNFLTTILPLSLFIVIAFIYHKMIMDRELVVMRSVGLSQFALAKPAIFLAMAMVTVGYFLSMYVVPTSYTKFREMQWDIRYNLSHVMLREGAFNEVTRGITVYVRKRSPDGQLLGIFAHDTRDPKKSYTLMAESGALIRTEEGARVVMSNGNRQDFDPKTKRASFLYFDSYAFDLKTSPATEGNRFREARERTLDELINIGPEVTRGRGKITVELHRRLAQPLSALGFALIPLAVLISGGFTRRGEGGRVIVAAALAVTYQVALLAIISAAAKRLDLVPLIYIITLLPSIIAAVVLFRYRTSGPDQAGIAVNGV